MKKNALIIVGIIILGIVGCYLIGKITNKNLSEKTLIPISGTTELSGVATATTTTGVKNTSITTSNTYLKIGQRSLINGVSITPSKVTYDSRCPKDVTCVQAGTVELGVLLESGSLSQNVIIVLNKATVFAGKQIILTSVTPSKISTKTIKESDYRFVITVKK